MFEKTFREGVMDELLTTDQKFSHEHVATGAEAIRYRAYLGEHAITPLR